MQKYQWTFVAGKRHLRVNFRVRYARLRNVGKQTAANALSHTQRGNAFSAQVLLFSCSHRLSLKYEYEGSTNGNKNRMDGKK